MIGGAWSKKNGKEQEVQEGWIGHVIPFELVQRNILFEDLADLEQDEQELAEIVTGYDNLLEELPEDEKEKAFVNDDKTAFVWKEVTKSIKAKEVEDDILQILQKASDGNKQEKKLKKQIKEKTEALHIKTKEMIEGLSDSDVKNLLREKWIVSLVDEILGLPSRIINELITKVEYLVGKYETTFEQVEAEINTTENELSVMLNELTGDSFDMQGVEELKVLLGGN